MDGQLILDVRVQVKVYGILIQEMLHMIRKIAISFLAVSIEIENSAEFVDYSEGIQRNQCAYAFIAISAITAFCITNIEIFTGKLVGNDNFCLLIAPQILLTGVKSH